MVMGLKTAKRLIIVVIGFSILIFGIILIFTPGPALVVIPMGLAVLAVQFAWARNLLKKMKSQLKGKGKKEVKETKDRLINE